MNVLFFHIPKTAGTFFANQLKHTLKLKLYRYFTESKVREELNCEEIPVDAVQALSNIQHIKAAQYTPCTEVNNLLTHSNTAVYAHEFDNSINPLINSSEWQKVTILRDPVERMFSAYAQRQRNNALSQIEVCDDLYQFYFLYKLFCKDAEILCLNEDTAPFIFNKALEAVKQLDKIFYQSKIEQQFKSYFKTPTILQYTPKNDNITDKASIMHIEYSLTKKISQFIYYDYKLLEATVF